MFSEQGHPGLAVYRRRTALRDSGIVFPPGRWLESAAIPTTHAYLAPGRPPDGRVGLSGKNELGPQPTRSGPHHGGFAMATTDEHDYVVRSVSTGTFGRVLLSARDQHVVVDGPARNGCPGEAMTPAELFLGGVATCAVELVQVIAREKDLALAGVEA